MTRPWISARAFVDFGDAGVSVAALEVTGGEERSLHCASAKGADAPVGMTTLRV
jgi:hypothetical protein